MNKVINKKGDLLLEFFSEEIPSRMQLNAEKQLENLFIKSLTNRDLHFDSFKTFSGPRHLSIIIKNIDLIQKDQKIEKRGPRYDADQKAIIGFLNSNNLDLTDTYIKETKNGRFYFYSQIIKGQKTVKILPDMINEIINSFIWPKSQRWANTDLKWARPLRNIILLLNDKVVKGKIILGKDIILNFTNFTFSHRYNDKKIIINKVQSYEKLLKNNNIIVDRRKRLNKIINDTLQLLDNKNLKLVDDKVLLEEVVGLVEFPNVLIGSINNQFMKLPREVLSTVMRVHQKYFSITDRKNNLVSKFLFVANSIKDKERDLRVIEGNERVLKARLSDAIYFMETDTSSTFENWDQKLKNVLFYEGLGSVHDKTRRMSSISTTFARTFGVKSNLAKQAAILSKADLVSEMVIEFPELQGIMGGYYAKIKNKSDEISKAIFEHYRPQGVSDDLPETKLGSLLSIVDKIDTLVGFFTIDKKPSGSKDPFALRRNGFSIVQILTHLKICISINELLKPPLKEYGCNSKSIKLSLVDFMIDKLRFILSNQNNRKDIVNSVLYSKILDDLPINVIMNRIEQISNYAEDKGFKLLLNNFKRINNILKSVKFSNNKEVQVNINLFQTIEEKKIYDLMNSFSKEIKEKGISDKYQGSLIKSLVKMNQSISFFFDNVIVNHNKEDIKINRLCLLKRLHNLILEFSNLEMIEI